MCSGHGAAYVDPDCAVITPTAASPASSRAGGVTMINKRVMPYCINLLDGNVACMMGAQSGGSGYYAAVNPQLQVDLLNTTSMTFSAGAARALARCCWDYNVSSTTGILQCPSILLHDCAFYERC